MDKRIAVVGSANADLVVDVARRPGAGETVLGSNLRIAPGGKGANQAVAAARLGARVSFVGAVGDDEHGRLVRDALTRAGVSRGGLTTVDRPTGAALVTITPDGRTGTVLAAGANEALSPELVDAAAEDWVGADVVVLQLEVPEATVRHVATRAAAAGSRVVLNAAPPAPLVPAVLNLADPLVVNEHEAAFLLRHSAAPSALRIELAGRASPLTAAMLATELLEVGPRSVVVTVGENGAVVIERTREDRLPEPVRLPAAPARVVDTWGAGDAFVGALATGLARGADLVSAAELGIRASAVAISRPGAQDSFPTPEEIDGVPAA